MNDSQVSDATLESWFAAAASEYEVPAGAHDRVLEAAADGPRRRRTRIGHPRLVAAGLLVIAAAGGATLWNGAGRQPGSVSSLKGHGPAAVDFQVGTSRAPLSTFYNGAQKSVGHGRAALPAAPAAQPRARGLDAAGPLADGAKIVHTGSLGLTVPKGQVTPVVTKLTGLASGVGGYVASSTSAENGTRPSGTVILRVPASSFDATLAQARTFGAVTSSASAAKDVTGSFTDLQARTMSLARTRDHYLTLLAKASTIGETLSVQQRVDDAQTQLDQLQGQINLMADQASMATLTVTVTQQAPTVVPPKTPPAHHQSGMSKAWHRAVDGFVTGAEALVARSGRGVLVLLVLAVTAAALRLAWHLGRRRLV